MNTSIKEYALKLISKKEYSSYKLQEKLNKKYPNDKILVQRIVKELINKGYINDNDYLNMYFNKYILSYKGIRYIKYKLLKEGFDESSIYSIYNIYKDKESDMLIKFIEKNKDIEQIKLIRKLIAKGYEYETVKKIIGG